MYYYKLFSNLVSGMEDCVNTFSYAFSESSCSMFNDNLEYFKKTYRFLSELKKHHKDYPIPMFISTGLLFSKVFDEMLCSYEENFIKLSPRSKSSFCVHVQEISSEHYLFIVNNSQYIFANYSDPSGKAWQELH